MKNAKLFAFAALIGASSFLMCGFVDTVVKNSNPESKVTNSETLGYAYGMILGSDLKNRGFNLNDVNPDEVVKGLKAFFGEAPAVMDMQAAQNLLNQETQKVKSALGNKNLEAGKKYMAENAKNPKVKTTVSGIQYEILTEGNGPKPAATDKVTTHYHGTLIDGTIFDSSVQRGQPIEFALNQVIKGWTEILQMMPKGSKWRVTIPSELAYGQQGPASIGPNSTLIFEIELFKINGQ